MPTDTTEKTYCNARLKGHDGLEKAEPSAEWAGPGYCKRLGGQRRCKDHGGNGGAPPTHGLYSFKREKLEERFREAYGGQDWADLRAEIAAVRALLSDYLSGLNEVDGNSIADATKLVGELRRLTKDLQEMLHRERLTRDEEQKLFNTFAEIIRDHVPESEQDAALGKLEATGGATGESSGDRALPSGG